MSQRRSLFLFIPPQTSKSQASFLLFLLLRSITMDLQPLIQVLNRAQHPNNPAIVEENPKVINDIMDHLNKISDQINEQIQKLGPFDTRMLKYAEAMRAAKSTPDVLTVLDEHARALQAKSRDEREKYTTELSSRQQSAEYSFHFSIVQLMVRLLGERDLTSLQAIADVLQYPKDLVPGLNKALKERLQRAT